MIVEAGVVGTYVAEADEVGVADLLADCCCENVEIDAGAVVGT